jgi:hypothetical protein
LVHLLSRVDALVLGNAATLYMNMIALREDDRADLFSAALTVLRTGC